MKTKIKQVVNSAGEDRWEVRLRIVEDGAPRHFRRRFESPELAAAALVAGNWTLKEDEEKARLALVRRNSAVAYVIAADGSPLVKIGQAVDVAHRLMNLQSGSPVRLYVLATFEGRDGRALERQLHRELAHARKHGEWFDLGADPLAVVTALVA